MAASKPKHFSGPNALANALASVPALAKACYAAGVASTRHAPAPPVATTSTQGGGPYVACTANGTPVYALVKTGARSSKATKAGYVVACHLATAKGFAKAPVCTFGAVGNGWVGGRKGAIPSA